MRYRTLLACIATAVLTGLLAAQAQVPGVNNTLSTVFTLAYDNSTMKPSYSATSFGTVPALSTDVCSLTGSATRRVKVRRIIISGQNSVQVSEPIAIIKRSTASSGAGEAMTKVAYDSNNAASTVGTAERWTAAPTTLGTIVGTLADVFVAFANLTTGVVAAPYVFMFGQLAQPVVLRGIAQSLNVNMEGQGGAVAGGTLVCTFEWTEDND